MIRYKDKPEDTSPNDEDAIPVQKLAGDVNKWFKLSTLGLYFKNFIGLVTGGNDGLMSSADKTKLDTVESGATADQTDAEIKTAYENNADTNAFTDSEKSKLAGVEAGAEVNPTPAEIKTDYESNANTNAYTDAEQTKLAGVEAGAEANPSDAEIKTAYENNANTNAFTDAEQTKLSGIEAGAQVNQDDATIKTQYENNADTNPFTDADQSKLLGIESGAQANQTDSEIKTQYENNADTNAFTDAEKTKLAGLSGGSNTILQFGASGVGKWLVDTTSQADDPAAGDLRWNNAGQGVSATEIYINITSEDGEDLEYYRELIEFDSKVAILKQDDLLQYQKYFVTGNVTINGSSLTIPVTSDGTSGGNFSDNDPVFLAVYVNAGRSRGSNSRFGLLETASSSEVDAGTAFQQAITPQAWAGSADKSKLDGIEAGAEVNPSDAEVKTAYENNANTNPFTDAEQSKLAGIENGATADQSDAEIKTAYENNANTNAFTDADETKLDGIQAGATANDTDANLRDRSTHTGTQTASTISDFESEVRSNSSQVIFSEYKIATTNDPVSTAGSALTAPVLAEMTHTFTPSSATSKIKVWFDGSFQNNKDQTAFVGVFIDGTLEAETEREQVCWQGEPAHMSTFWQGSLPVAPVTITIRFWRSGNNLTAIGLKRGMLIEETEE